MAAAVLDAVGVAVEVPDAVAPGLLDPVGVCVMGGDSVDVADGEEVGVRVRGAVRVRLVEGVPVWLGEGEVVRDGVRLDDRVLLAVSIDVCVSLEEPVCLHVSVLEGVVDGELVNGAPMDMVEVGVAVDLGVFDAERLPVLLVV